jgi:DNA-binding FadR family transcriptional regulator
MDHPPLMAGEIGARSFRPPSRRRVHEEIAEQLRDAILDGHFAPGQRLPPERELAERFQVNRTSIRDAIKVLEGLGLVSVRQGDGAAVRPLVEASLDVVAPMVFHGGSVDHAALKELYEVIVPLLVEMARLAVERHTAGQLDELRMLRDRMADVSLDCEERFAAGRDVLVLLADMTGNRVWRMLARQTRRMLASEPMCAARQRLGQEPGRAVPLIDDCLTAVRAGRPDDAVAVLRDIVRLIGDVAWATDDRDDENGERAERAAF